MREVMISVPLIEGELYEDTVKRAQAKYEAQQESKLIADFIKETVSGKINRKVSRYYQILGCTREELIEKLSCQSGECIDHIIPKRAANRIEDVWMLNHISNLQVTSLSENMDKSSSINMEDVERVKSQHIIPEMLTAIVDKYVELIAKPIKYKRVWIEVK